MKETLYKIKIHQRAKIALDALSAEEKDIVWQAINHLAVSGIEPALGVNLERFKTDKSLYLLKVNSSFRAILKLSVPDEIEILDIVMRDRLELFATPKH
jgi:hypothetical protein